MNPLRQICAATILSLTLSVSVLAGHIDTPAAPTPAPPSNTSTTTTTIVLTILGLIYR